MPFIPRDYSKPSSPDANQAVTPGYLSKFIDDLIGHFISTGTEPPADASSGASPIPQPIDAQVPADPTQAPLQKAYPELALPSMAIPPSTPDMQVAPAQPQPDIVSKPVPDVMTPPDENLFPTDALTVTGQDMADAAGAPPIDEGNPTGKLGKALSGIKAPTGTGYQQPSAPSIPQTKQLDSNFLVLLQAAGLAPQKPIAGLNLGTRLR